MFRTSKCSSSGSFIHAVLWYFFYAEIKITDHMNGLAGPSGRLNDEIVGSNSTGVMDVFLL